MSDLKATFESSIDELKKLTARPDDETLLELYSYFKQATEGDVSGDRPGPFDFKGRAKFDAWADRKGMSREVAMKGYVKLVNHLKGKDKS